MMEAARQQRQTKERMGKGMDDENEAGSIILGYTYAVRIPSLPSSSTIVEQSVVDEERDAENDESCIIVEGGVPFSSKKTVTHNLRIDVDDENESRPTQPLKSITSRRRSRCKEEEDEEEEVDDDEEEEEDDDNDEPFTTARSNDDDDDNDEEEEEDDEEEEEEGDDDDEEPFTTARSNDDNDNEEEGEEEDDVEPFTTARSNDDNDNNAFIIPTPQILRVNEEEDITTTVSNDILREGIRTVNAYAAYDKDDDEDNDNDDDDDDLSTHVMFDEVDGRGCSSSSPEDRPILLKSATSLTSLRSSLLSAGKNNAFHQIQSLSKRWSSSSSNNNIRRNSTTTSNNVTNKEYWLRQNCHHLLDHIDTEEDNTGIFVIHPVVGEEGKGTEDKDENTMEMVFYETY